MKTLCLLAILLGSTWFLSAQNGSEIDEIAKLKKQVIELRNKNAQLEKTVKMLSVKSTETQNNLSVQLNENSQKLAALQDTVKVRERMLKNTRGTALMALKSLRHRKTLAKTGVIIAILVFAGVSWVLIRKYKADAGKSNQQLFELKKIQQEELEKERSERIQQINALKESMEQKLTEQDRQIADQKRIISELKNKG